MYVHYSTVHIAKNSDSDSDRNTQTDIDSFCQNQINMSAETITPYKTMVWN